MAKPRPRTDETKRRGAFWNGWTPGACGDCGAPTGTLAVLCRPCAALRAEKAGKRGRVRRCLICRVQVLPNQTLCRPCRDRQRHRLAYAAPAVALRRAAPVRAMRMDAPPPPRCAVCDRRPCACDVDVLGAILRDASQLPRADGVTIVSMRGSHERPRPSATDDRLYADDEPARGGAS